MQQKSGSAAVVGYRAKGEHDTEVEAGRKALSAAEEEPLRTVYRIGGPDPHEHSSSHGPAARLHRETPSSKQVTTGVLRRATNFARARVCSEARFLLDETAKRQVNEWMMFLVLKNHDRVAVRRRLLTA